jgi:hypothetical protein
MQFKEKTVFRLGLRHQRNVDDDLTNIFREFDEALKLSNTLYPDSEIDEKF